MAEKQKRLKAFPQGSSIIIDFGEMVIEAPTGYKVPVTNVKVGAAGLIHFRADGVKDFLSIRMAVFGHEPYYISSYTILEDKTGLGKTGLETRVRGLRKMNGNTYTGRRCTKDGYREVFMMFGDVLCAKVNESGEIQIKIYNENGKPYVGYYRLDPDQKVHLLTNSYPEGLLNSITDLIIRNIELIYDWAKRKKPYKRYLRSRRKTKNGR